MKTILEHLQATNEYISASCNGDGKCGQCRVCIQNREVSICHEEEKLIPKEQLEQGYRLACKHRYYPGDKIVVDKKQSSIKEDICLTSAIDDEKQGYGIIVDIGTTTLVAKLIEQKTGIVVKTTTMQNPQVSYGGDVIRRISYDENHPNVLHQQIKQAIFQIIEPWLDYIIDKMVVCGNTTMTHLFIGSDVQPLGKFPFEVPNPNAVILNSKEFYSLNQEFMIYCFPPISAYVGGDIVSGMYGLSINTIEENILFLDLGTNAEIIGKRNQQYFACSAPAGPAFEGSGITCGSGSVEGAIYQVEQKEGQLFYQTIGNKEIKSICGTGLISLIAYLRREEIIDEIGNFYDEREKFPITNTVYLTKKDIQTFLLAKAAIQVSLEIMMEQIGFIDTIYLSGGFSNALKLEDLLTLQMTKEVTKIKVCPNTALQGAYRFLLEGNDFIIGKMISQVQSVDLKGTKDFNDRLVDGLFL